MSCLNSFHLLCTKVSLPSDQHTEKAYVCGEEDKGSGQESTLPTPRAVGPVSTCSLSVCTRAAPRTDTGCLGSGIAGWDV